MSTNMLVQTTSTLKQRWTRGPSARVVVPLLVLVLAIAVVHAIPSVEERDRISRSLVTDHDAAIDSAAARGGEVLPLRWKLGGFLGTLAGLFIPSSGDALLTFVPQSEERVEIQFLVTAPGRDGEYFLYGAEIDENNGSTVAVWSSQMFRQELKQEEQVVDDQLLIDYASAIYHLRWNPPAKPTRMTIWSGGKTYPVEVEPLKPSKRKVEGKKIAVRGYLLRGVKVDGERSFDDKIYLYFARDAQATPVEIVGKRGWVKVRIGLAR